MSEDRKTPLGPQSYTKPLSEKTPEQSNRQQAKSDSKASATGGSLFERVMGGLPFGKQAPKPNVPPHVRSPRSVAGRGAYPRAGSPVFVQPMNLPPSAVPPLAPAPYGAAGVPLDAASLATAPAAGQQASQQVAPTTTPEPEVVAEPSIFHGPFHPVDRDHLREQGLIVPEGTVTTLWEEFRIIKRQLLVQAADLRRQKAGPMAQRILISSPHPGEGKTYCALNLALSIATEKESEVLLVDADFAKPSILSALGLPGGPGLMDALMDESVDAADCVLGTDIPGLWVLPAGDATSHDSEYLSASRTQQVLDQLTQATANRILIFDSPPALAASPAAELAKYVGQTVVIVRADKTGRGALDDAISLLDACPNLQLLLNAVQFSPSGRRFGAYYGYRG